MSRKILDLSGFPRRPEGVRESLGSALRVADVGPVAQLGERLVCIQEVVGSNPVGSTNLPAEDKGL